MSDRRPFDTMQQAPLTTLSQRELAQRWGRSLSAIRLCSAVGLGPRYIKADGTLRYPEEEVQKYERLHRPQ